MKKVNLNLVGVDGNAFNILGLFKAQAKKEGWTKQEIDAVVDEAMSSDYNHLLATIQKHICISTPADDECVECGEYSENCRCSEYEWDDND